MVCPISAHLEQRRSLEIFSFFSAKELEHQIGGLLSFPLWEEPGDLPNSFEMGPFPHGLLVPVDTLTLWFL